MLDNRIERVFPNPTEKGFHGMRSGGAPIMG